MAKPDSPPGQDKPDKDSPADHDQGQGNDPEANQDLPKPESPASADEEDGEPEVEPTPA